MGVVSRPAVVIGEVWLDKLRLVKRVGAVHPTTLNKLLTTLQSVFAPA
jgi:mRNA-degrading endonuclease toxin of MazEF toxin-antitoxin module